MEGAGAKMNFLHFSDTMIKTEPPDDYPDPVFSTSSGDADAYNPYYSADVNLEYNLEPYHYQNIKEEPEGGYDYGYPEAVMHPLSEQLPEISQNLPQIKVEPVDEELQAICSPTPSQCPFPSTLFAGENQSCAGEEASEAQHVVFLPDNSTAFVTSVENCNSGEVRSSNEAAYLTDHSSTESSDMLTPIIVNVQGNFSFHDLKSHEASLEEEREILLSEADGEPYISPAACTEMTAPSLALSGSLSVPSMEDSRLNSPRVDTPDGQDMQTGVHGSVEGDTVVKAVDKSTQVGRGKGRKRKNSRPERTGSAKRPKKAAQILKVNHKGVETYIAYPAVSDKIVVGENADGMQDDTTKCIYCPEFVERGQLLLHYLQDHGIAMPEPDKKIIPARMRKKLGKKKEKHQEVFPKEEKPRRNSSVRLKSERANFEQRLKDSYMKQQVKEERARKHLEVVKEECLAITIGNKMRYRCVICPEEYSAVGIFYHAKAHGKDLSAVCKGCKSDIHSVQDLRRHIQSCQDKLEEVVTSCKCVVCLAECKEGIFFHAVLHEKELPTYCAGCCQRIYSVFDVRQHSRICQARIVAPVVPSGLKQKTQKKSTVRSVPRILRRSKSQKSPQEEPAIPLPDSPQVPMKRKSRNGQKQGPNDTAGKTEVCLRNDVSETVSAAPTRTPNSKAHVHPARSQKSSRPVRNVPQIVVDVVREEDNYCLTGPLGAESGELEPQQSQTSDSAVASRTRRARRTQGGTGCPSKTKSIIEQPPKEELSQGADSGPVTRRKSSRLCAKMAAASGSEVTVSCAVSSDLSLSHSGCAGAENGEKTSPSTESCRLRPRKGKILVKS